jgi:hypothetical protein
MSTTRHQVIECIRVGEIDARLQSFAGIRRERLAYGARARYCRDIYMSTHGARDYRCGSGMRSPSVYTAASAPTGA